MSSNTKSFSSKEAVRFGWETTKKNFWFLVGITAVMGLIQFIPGFLESYLRDQEALLGVINIIGYVVSLVLSLGLIKIVLAFYDKRKPQFSELFAFDPKLILRYFLATLLYSLIVLLGFILLIIPGVYLSIKYGFYPYLIVDKNMGVFESFSKSGEIAKGNIWNLFVFGLLLMLIAIVGIVALLVGLLVALPVISLAEVYVYRKLVSSSSK